MNNDTANRKLQKELNAGAVSLVLLQTLRRAGEPMYGYEIAKQLEATAGRLPMNQAAIYPALRSLEKSGLLTSNVQPSVSGPPRRYYRITAKGKKTLAGWGEVWKQTKQFVDLVLEPADADTRSKVPGNAGTGAKATTGRRTRRRAGRRTRVS